MVEKNLVAITPKFFALVEGLLQDTTLSLSDLWVEEGLVILIFWVSK